MTTEQAERIASLEGEAEIAQRTIAELREVLEDVVAFWDSITMEDCVNDIHVKARAALERNPPNGERLKPTEP